MSASSLLLSGSSAVNPAYLWACGSATLVAGTIAVAFPAIGADDNVVLTRTSAASANGLAIAITAGTGFTITSSSNADVGTIRWTWLKAHA
jgi:hypothetical protein